MKSVMVHSFAQVPKVDVPRSVFNRSHGYKTTFDAGYLVPFYADEALPGDTINLRASGFARLATPIKPIMDNMKLETFFFAVPLRLIWNNFQKFMGEQENPDDSTDYLCPQIGTPSPAGAAIGSLMDYLGIPTEVASVFFNAFHTRAYNLIYNEWFRDQNMQNSVVVDKDDGPDSASDYVLLRRGKRHDYFTSCLKWPQKGPDVQMPLGSTAPVVSNGVSPEWTGDGRVDATMVSIAPNSLGIQGSSWTSPPQNVIFGTETGLEADLSTASAATINAWREAIQTQAFFEIDARSGTRYTEVIKGHFGVTSPDARLQRPEYLGGGSTDVNVHPVAQTAASPSTPTGLNAQGNLAAFGTVSFSGHGFVKSFTEHCVVLGLVNVRADLTYQQGLERMYSRRTRFDFFWPVLARLGEQEVLSKEIFTDGTAGDDLVFGYQERYAEYRYKPSRITGLFRSTTSQSLDIWHLSEEFGARPELTSGFIVDNPPVDRVIAVPSEPHFLFDSYLSIKHVRPMPVFGVPGALSRF